MLEVIDFEAAGLGAESYPIEVGIALADGSKHNWLIRPMAHWAGWCDEAEAIHGIAREQLMHEGWPVIEVCEALNYYCQERVLYSDCWVYDNSWLHLLFTSAGIRQTFSISPIEREFSDERLAHYSAYKREATQLLGLQAHRAGNDAKIIQAALQSLQHRPRQSKVSVLNPVRQPVVRPTPSASPKPSMSVL